MKPALQSVDRQDGAPSAETDKVIIDNAIATGRAALIEWRAVGAQQRLKFLEDFGGQLQANRDELVDLLVEDIGKPIRYARAEHARSIALIDAAVQQIDLGQDHLPKKTGYRREPLGDPLALRPGGLRAGRLLYEKPCPTRRYRPRSRP